MLTSALSTLAGIAVLYFWKESQVAKVSSSADTGTKTPDGKSIIEVTGKGGVDNGKKVKGYALPENINEVKLPLTVVVKPNEDLFLMRKGGEKVTFTGKRNDELIWLVTTGDATGDYTVWYPDLRKKVLGEVK